MAKTTANIVQEALNENLSLPEDEKTVGEPEFVHGLSSFDRGLPVGDDHYQEPANEDYLLYPSCVEATGIISVKRQVEAMIRAGRRLIDYRGAGLYDSDLYGDDIDDDLPIVPLNADPLEQMDIARDLETKLKERVARQQQQKTQTPNTPELGKTENPTPEKPQNSAEEKN